jgi:hypothetical protein
MAGDSLFEIQRLFSIQMTSIYPLLIKITRLQILPLLFINLSSQTWYVIFTTNNEDICISLVIEAASLCISLHTPMGFCLTLIKKGLKLTQINTAFA